jgi:hypothetical protein
MLIMSSIGKVAQASFYVVLSLKVAALPYVAETTERR